MKGFVKNNCNTRRAVLAVGLALFFVGFNAVAQDGSISPSYGDWFKVIIGLLLALVGAYAKGVESRVTKTEAKLEASGVRITDLRELLAGQHYDKDEIDRRFDRLEQMITGSRTEASSGISALHMRLDQLRVPPASAQRNRP